MDRTMRKLNELNPDIDMLSIDDTSFLPRAPADLDSPRLERARH